MMSGGDYGRHRMDRSLDEIAAEMNSNQGKWEETTSSLPFGKDYEEREYVGAPIRDTSSSSSRRHAPYSTSRGHIRGSRDKSSEREYGNRVFIANLSYNTTWQNLKDYMRKAGPVAKCDVFRDASGNSRGMGLVVYNDVEGAETALKTLSGTELDNRKIYLRKDMQHEERERSGLTSYRGRGKPPPNPSATVFIGNLDYGVTWQKLKDIFKVAGRIVNADVMMDQDGKSKGVGEVQFEDPSDTIGAIALFHGQMLSDRPMTVRMDSRAPFQPDPLQLKLSSLGANTGLGSDTYVGKTHHGDYGYDQRGHAHSGQYTHIREVQHVPTERRSTGFGMGVSSRHDYHDSRRGYDSSPHAFYSRSGGDSYSSSSGVGGASDYRSYSRRGNEERRGGSNSDISGGNKRLFVKNLNYSTTWQHLKDTFRGAGSVQHVDIMENPDGRSKGCAVVWFDAADSARKAIDMFNDLELDGRKMEVRYDRLG